MQVDDAHWQREPWPLSWKYVNRSRGNSNWTWSDMVCLLIPTFDAFVVTRMLNFWSSMCLFACVSSSLQNNQKCQNLSILWRAPWILITSMTICAASNCHSMWLVMFWEWCRELQKYNRTLTKIGKYKVNDLTYSFWHKLRPLRTKNELHWYLTLLNVIWWSTKKRIFTQ